MCDTCKWLERTERETRKKYDEAVRARRAFHQGERDDYTRTQKELAPVYGEQLTGVLQLIDKHNRKFHDWKLVRRDPV